MQDRIPLYPGRVTLTPVEGQANTYDMVRADQPSQVGTALSKANLLKDLTAAQFGLDENAVPDDVLSWLGKYNEHWWSALHGQASSYYKEKLTSVKGESNAYDVASYTRKQLIYYSRELSFGSSGEVSLKNASTFELSSSEYGATQFCALAPCYFYGAKDNSSQIYYMPTGANSSGVGANTATFLINGNGDDDYDYFVFINDYDTVKNPVSKVSSMVVQIPAGETTYEHSTDRNAYPDSGTQDGITYTYLGVPFEKFPTMPQIELASYDGTGTYGQSNPCSLTFQFAPKLLLYAGYVDWDLNNGTIFGINDRTGSIIIPSLLHTDKYGDSHYGFYSSYSSKAYAKRSDDGKTIYWFSNQSATEQSNIIGNTYYYIALG